MDRSFWVPQRIGNDSVGTGVVILSATETLVCGDSDLWRSNLPAANRTYPTLLALPDRSALLATANLDGGRIDLIRSADLQAWTDLEEPKEATITFTAGATTTPQPALTRLDDGSLLLTAGASVVVSPDGDPDNWVAQNHASLLVPVGVLPNEPVLCPANLLNRSRRSLAYGGGRIVNTLLYYDSGASPSFYLVTLTAREWQWGQEGNYFPAVLPGVAQWVGVDDLRVIWGGTTVPMGERWTINPRYRFPATALLEETRSLWWQSIDNSQPATFHWNRAHPDVVAQLGRGQSWNASAVGLFGTNFVEATVAISIPSYNGTSFPTATANYTEFRLSAELERAMVSITPPAAQPDVLHCAGKLWTPGQWASGSRQYYVTVPPAIGGVETWPVYVIRGNTETALMIERDDTDQTILAGSTAIIFGDRMVTLCTDGNRAGVPVTVPLLGSPYEFGQWLRLRVPAQLTASGQRTISNMVLARHVPIRIERPEGAEPRRPIEAGYRWQPMATIAEDEGVSGVTALEHLGRTRQRWTFSYSGVEWWDRSLAITPFIPALRRAFALIMDSAHPNESLEWVRLTTNLPEVIHSGDDLYGYQLELAEVL